MYFSMKMPQPTPPDKVGLLLMIVAVIHYKFGLKK
jgi:hypothetical protein